MLFIYLLLLTILPHQLFTSQEIVARQAGPIVAEGASRVLAEAAARMGAEELAHKFLPPKAPLKGIQVPTAELTAQQMQGLLPPPPTETATVWHAPQQGSLKVDPSLQLPKVPSHQQITPEIFQQSMQHVYPELRNIPQKSWQTLFQDHSQLIQASIHGTPGANEQIIEKLQQITRGPTATVTPQSLQLVPPVSITEPQAHQVTKPATATAITLPVTPKSKAIEQLLSKNPALQSQLETANTALESLSDTFSTTKSYDELTKLWKEPEDRRWTRLTAKPKAAQPELKGELDQVQQSITTMQTKMKEVIHNPTTTPAQAEQALAEIQRLAAETTEQLSTIQRKMPEPTDDELFGTHLPTEFTKLKQQADALQKANHEFLQAFKNAVQTPLPQKPVPTGQGMMSSRRMQPTQYSHPFSQAMQRMSQYQPLAKAAETSRLDTLRQQAIDEATERIDLDASLTKARAAKQADLLAQRDDALTKAFETSRQNALRRETQRKTAEALQQTTAHETATRATDIVNPEANQAAKLMQHAQRLKDMAEQQTREKASLVDTEAAARTSTMAELAKSHKTLEDESRRLLQKEQAQRQARNRFQKRYDERTAQLKQKKRPDHKVKDPAKARENFLVKSRTRQEAISAKKPLAKTVDTTKQDKADAFKQHQQLIREQKQTARAQRTKEVQARREQIKQVRAQQQATERSDLDASLTKARAAKEADLLRQQQETLKDEYEKGLETARRKEAKRLKREAQQRHKERQELTKTADTARAKNIIKPETSARDALAKAAEISKQDALKRQAEREVTERKDVTTHEAVARDTATNLEASERADLMKHAQRLKDMTEQQTREKASLVDAEAAARTSTMNDLAKSHKALEEASRKSLETASKKEATRLRRDAQRRQARDTKQRANLTADETAVRKADVAAPEKSARNALRQLEVQSRQDALRREAQRKTTEALKQTTTDETAARATNVVGPEAIARQDLMAHAQRLKNMTEQQKRIQQRKTQLEATEARTRTKDIVKLEATKRDELAHAFEAGKQAARLQENIREASARTATPSREPTQHSTTRPPTNVTTSGGRSPAALAPRVDPPAKKLSSPKEVQNDSSNKPRPTPSRETTQPASAITTPVSRAGTQRSLQLKAHSTPVTKLPDSSTPPLPTTVQLERPLTTPDHMRQLQSDMHLHAQQATLPTSTALAAVPDTNLAPASVSSMSEQKAIEALNLPANPTKIEIKDAFKTAALKYHPDKNQGDDTFFKLAQEAYERLMNPPAKTPAKAPLQIEVRKPTTLPAAQGKTASVQLQKPRSSDQPSTFRAIPTEGRQTPKPPAKSPVQVVKAQELKPSTTAQPSLQVKADPKPTKSLAIDTVRTPGKHGSLHLRPAKESLRVVPDKVAAKPTVQKQSPSSNRIADLPSEGRVKPSLQLRPHRTPEAQVPQARKPELERTSPFGKRFERREQSRRAEQQRQEPPKGKQLPKGKQSPSGGSAHAGKKAFGIGAEGMHAVLADHDIADHSLQVQHIIADKSDEFNKALQHLNNLHEQAKREQALLNHQAVQRQAQQLPLHPATPHQQGQAKPTVQQPTHKPSVKPKVKHDDQVARQKRAQAFGGATLLGPQHPHYDDDTNRRANLHPAIPPKGNPPAKAKETDHRQDNLHHIIDEDGYEARPRGHHKDDPVNPESDAEKKPDGINLKDPSKQEPKAKDQVLANEQHEEQPTKKKQKKKKEDDIQLSDLTEEQQADSGDSLQLQDHDHHHHHNESSSVIHLKDDQDSMTHEYLQEGLSLEEALLLQLLPDLKLLIEETHHEKRPQDHRILRSRFSRF